MINNKYLEQYCNNLLAIDNFADYCPNGLQIEGKKQIKKIIVGVSCNLALIEKAILNKADAIIVHHGFFWKNEKIEITGIKRKRIKLLLANNINLYTYHLPLDAHLELGNNAQLAKILEIKNAKPIKNSLVWLGNLDIKTSDFSNIIYKKLSRKPQIFNPKQQIKKIGFCTGAAQNYIDIAIENGADCYLSGEISENIPALAIENNITYIQAGHYFTEQGGVLALGNHLSVKFNLVIKFIKIDNSV